VYVSHATVKPNKVFCGVESTDLIAGESQMASHRLRSLVKGFEFRVKSRITVSQQRWESPFNLNENSGGAKHELRR